jgi:hypothetical protein
MAQRIFLFGDIFSFLYGWFANLQAVFSNCILRDREKAGILKASPKRKNAEEKP